MNYANEISNNDRNISLNESMQNINILIYLIFKINILEIYIMDFIKIKSLNKVISKKIIL